MMEVHGKCKLENPCESFYLQKARHAQFLRKRTAHRVRCDAPNAKRESASRCSRFHGAVSVSETGCSVPKLLDAPRGKGLRTVPFQNGIPADKPTSSASACQCRGWGRR